MIKVVTPSEVEGAPTRKGKTHVSKMKESIKLGAEFWNDSCDLEHLSEAVQRGAVGATCNPLIVYQAITRQKELWACVLKSYLSDHTQATEAECANYLIQHAGREASKVLLPIYEKTEGRKGKLSLQVNPYFYTSMQKMLENGIALADLAPNITIKVPATETGIQCMEELSALGISVNATVSFSVAQAVASAEAIERGLKRAQQSGKLSASHSSYVTIMVGRVEDYVRNSLQAQKISINPIAPLFSGVAVFKKAHELFFKRSYKATLLSAAYRHQLHWSELIGEGVVLSIPYEWWKQFDKSNAIVSKTLHTPVKEGYLSALREVPQFNSLMEESLLKPKDFVHMTPSKNTLNQFLGGQDDLVKWIRSLMV